MLQYNKIKNKKFNPKTYAKFMDKNFATDYLTDTFLNHVVNISLYFLNFVL